MASKLKLGLAGLVLASGIGGCSLLDTNGVKQMDAGNDVGRDVIYDIRQDAGDATDALLDHYDANDVIDIQIDRPPKCENLELDCIDGGDASDNHAPAIILVDDMGMPYAERDAIQNVLSLYRANTSDLDGDPIECRFEFSDGFLRNWNPDCSVNHAI